MQLRLLDVTVDLQTTRLIKAARAAKLARHLDADAAKLLLDGALAVRLYAEAGAPQAAEATLVDLFHLVGQTDADDFRALIEHRLAATAHAVNPRGPVIQSVGGVPVLRAITAA